MSEEISEIKGFLRGFLWGILLAIGSLFFLETKKGEKIKKKLRAEGEDLLDELPNLIEDFENKVGELVEEVMEIEEEAKEKVVEISQELKGKTEEKVTALPHIEAIQEHGREVAGGIKKRLFKNIPRKKRKALPN